jgi:prophage regulatory protein
MRRLPMKTQSPIRMNHNGGQRQMNGHAAAEPPTASVGPVQLLGSALPLKLLRFPAIRERTGLSRTTIWRLERSGDFPRHRRISANAVAWVEEEVLGWIRSRIGVIAV